MTVQSIIRYQYFNENDFSKDDIEFMLQALPKFRHDYVEKYKFKRDKISGILSYKLLSSIIGFMPEFEYGKYGKPYLSDGPHFSISHTRNYIAVAVCDRPIGIDVEMIKNDNSHIKLQRMVLSHQEQKAGLTGELDFYKLWTKKESYIKMLGTGLSTDLKSLTFLDLSDVIELGDAVLATSIQD